MYRKTKKLLALALAVSMILTQMLFSNVAFAAESDRLYGTGRVETAIEVSKAGWTTSDYAVLATAWDSADALAAAVLAAKYDAPILLTDKEALPAAVLTELGRLGVKNVFIVGGEGAVSAAVATAVDAAVETVERIAGTDRVDTALKIAAKLDASDTVVLVNGYAPADALSIAPIAAAQGWPILLVESAGTLSDAVKAYIGTKDVYVVGGTGVVSDAVLTAVAGERIAGAGRYDTNVEVLKKFVDVLDYTNVFVATGEDYPDALAAAALAAKVGAPIVLVGSSNVAATYAATMVTADSLVLGLGGPAVVSNSVLAGIVPAAPATFEVTSVSAVNLKQVLVKFSKEVDKTFAENAAKYRYNGSWLVAGTDHVKLQADKKSVLVTLGGVTAPATKMDNNTSYDFKVDPILSTTGEYSAAYTTTVKFADSVIPSVGSVEVTGSKVLKVVFNEPVYDGAANSYTIPALRFSVDGGVYPVVSALYKASINAVEVTLYTALSAGSHTLKVKPDTTNAIVDYAGYKPLEQEVTFTVVADTAAPTVTVKEATDTSVTVVFSESMKVSSLVGNANIRFRHSYNETLTPSTNMVTGTSVVAVANTSDKEFTINFGTSNILPVGPNKLYFAYPDSSGDKVEDMFGNALAAGSVDMTVVQDVVAPAVDSVVYVDKNTLEVTFSEGVAGGNVPSNYTVKDKDGATINVTGATLVAGTDTYRLTTGTAMNGGAHTIAIANIKDTSLKANVMAGVTVSFVASDTTAPGVKRAVVFEAGKKIRVYFNEDMQDAGLTEKGNYSYQVGAGAVTPLATADTLTKIDSKTVEIVFAAIPAGITAGDKVYISGALKDLAGNRMVSDIMKDYALVLDNTTITVSYESGSSKVAHALDKRTIEFKIDRLVQSVTPGLITFSATGNTVSSATAVNDTVTGKATIKLNLSADLDTSLGTAFNINFGAGAFVTLLGETSLLQNAAFNNTQIKDLVAPKLLTVATKDNDGDRQLDQMVVTYSEAIQTTSVQATDYTVEGYVVNDVSVNGAVVTVKINESGVIDDTATPKVTQVGEIADDSAQHNVLGAQSAKTAADAILPTITSVTSGTYAVGSGVLTLTVVGATATGDLVDVTKITVKDVDAALSVALTTSTGVVTNGTTLTVTLSAADKAAIAAAAGVDVTVDVADGVIKDAATNVSAAFGAAQTGKVITMLP